MTRKIHVLLVEDNAADADLMRASLVGTDFEIQLSIAKNGAEAIDFLNSTGNGSEPGHPTLIILDLNLPRRDGRQVLAVIKSDDNLRRIPVVVLSSSDSEKDITSCYNLGANSYIIKPPELQAYRAAVRKLEDFWLGTATLPNRDGHSHATSIGYGI